MSSVSPIQTGYRGYRFRSRLEARWAVFFETLELHWEYEPEGFELGAAGRYLPDFKVRYPGTAPEEIHWNWFECKPSLLEVPDPDWARMISWKEQTGQSLVILDGHPSLQMYLELSNICGSANGLSVPGRETLAAEMSSHRDGLALYSNKGRLWWDPYENFFGEDACFYMCPPELEEAVRAARAARFEFADADRRV